MYKIYVRRSHTLFMLRVMRPINYLLSTPPKYDNYFSIQYVKFTTLLNMYKIYVRRSHTLFMLRVMRPINYLLSTPPKYDNYFSIQYVKFTTRCGNFYYSR